MEKCKDLKKKYDDCFNNWLCTKFLRGNTDDSECAFLLKVYRECVLNAMKEQEIDMTECDTSHFPPENDQEGH